ncbi:two-component system response regulator LytT [Clostridium saccharobutylicum]|uniref:LytR/AlgR family response regulator transcription factor n=1 Tax=Clostridium saccharobutylicum TaxID=169679 RepID=UPI00149472CE|nr:LytTR family DNA-binding domain-containing protein [Clostridium saccharobutylicum]NOW29455.1 two-component system response regulator LytT [Clostridium saccharobutylicum]
MYSVILVEDNIEERNILKKMLLSISEFIKIYEADSEATALNIIQNNDINMFLIDINLKQYSGLDLAMKIRSISKYEFRQIIFLTTHMAYITQAFKKTHCYDYILKPYDHKEVQVMLNKLILNESSYKDKVEEKELVITLKSGIYVGIKIREIIFIEVIGKNCEVNTINGLYIANNMSLKKIMKLIDCDDIIQSHRSFAVNKDYISKIEKIDIKLSAVYFNNSSKTALLGYKFKNNVIDEFKKGKVILC